MRSNKLEPEQTIFCTVNYGSVFNMHGSLTRFGDGRFAVFPVTITKERQATPKKGEGVNYFRAYLAFPAGSENTLPPVNWPLRVELGNKARSNIAPLSLVDFTTFGHETHIVKSYATCEFPEFVERDAARRVAESTRRHTAGLFGRLGLRLT